MKPEQSGLAESFKQHTRGNGKQLDDNYDCRDNRHAPPLSVGGNKQVYDASV